MLLSKLHILLFLHFKAYHVTVKNLSVNALITQELFRCSQKRWI